MGEWQGKEEDFSYMHLLNHMVIASHVHNLAWAWAMVEGAGAEDEGEGVGSPGGDEGQETGEEAGLNTGNPRGRGTLTRQSTHRALSLLLVSCSFRSTDSTAERKRKAANHWQPSRIAGQWHLTTGLMTGSPQSLFQVCLSAVHGYLQLTKSQGSLRGGHLFQSRNSFSQMLENFSATQMPPTIRSIPLNLAFWPS